MPPNATCPGRSANGHDLSFAFTMSSHLSVPKEKTYNPIQSHHPIYKIPQIVIPELPSETTNCGKTMENRIFDGPLNQGSCNLSINPMKHIWAIHGNPKSSSCMVKSAKSQDSMVFGILSCWLNFLFKKVHPRPHFLTPFTGHVYRVTLALIVANG